MHSYYKDESQEGSHFFIQSPQETKYLFRIDNSIEEYIDDFLEDKIKNTTLHNFTVSPKPKFLECCELFKTIKQIIFDHINNFDDILKIELEKDSPRKDLVVKFFKHRPSHIKGLTHVINGLTVYYFFSSDRIESTELISALVKEFRIEDG